MTTPYHNHLGDKAALDEFIRNAAWTTGILLAVAVLIFVIGFTVGFQTKKHLDRNLVKQSELFNSR